MPESTHDLSRQLAVVATKLDYLIKEVADVRADMVDSEGKSDASRATVHRRLDEVVNRTGTLEGKMAAVEETVRDVKTVTDEVTRWRLMGLGALGITGIAASSITALVTAYWDQIVKVFRG